MKNVSGIWGGNIFMFNGSLAHMISFVFLGLFTKGTLSHPLSSWLLWTLLVGRTLVRWLGVIYQDFG